MNTPSTKAEAKMQFLLGELRKANFDVSDPIFNKRLQAWRMFVRGSGWALRAHIADDGVTVWKASGHFDDRAMEVFEFLLGFQHHI